MAFEKITEQDSLYDQLENYSVEELVNGIHTEDQKVALAVGKVLPNITQLIEKIEAQLRLGGRLFYMGAGTSGRLGILDASECPPTFGTDPNTVVGLIAGGNRPCIKRLKMRKTPPPWVGKTCSSTTSMKMTLSWALPLLALPLMSFTP